MKTAHYRKDPGAARAWYLVIAGEAKPEVGESVEVFKRKGGSDIVVVTQVTSEASPWVCRFERKRGLVDVAHAPTVIAADFLTDTPQPRQDAPQATLDDDPPDDIEPLTVSSNGGEKGIADAITQALGQTAAKVAAKLEVRINAALDDLRGQLRDIQARPQHTVIQVPGFEPIKLEGFQHPLFEKVLRLVGAGLNVMLVGEAGTGKTFLAHQVSQAFSRDFGTVHCTAGMSESHVSGYLLPTGEAGRFEYHPAEFVRMYESGNCVFLLDEMDAADPNVLMFLNGALANGVLHIPHRLQGSCVKRGPNVAIMAAVNTFGHGANAKYQGRNALDGATLDRFYLVEMGYDDARERAMFGTASNQTPWKPSKHVPDDVEIRELGEWVLNLRERVRTSQLRRIVGRTLDKALTALKVGVPMAEVKRDVLLGWTKDELVKVGE